MPKAPASGKAGIGAGTTGAGGSAPGTSPSDPSAAKPTKDMARQPTTINAVVENLIMRSLCGFDLLKHFYCY
jgi:hypothetical protein